MTNVNANLSVVPLLHWPDDQSVRFLGTGAFIKPYDLLLTANHVVAELESHIHVVTTERLGERFAAAVVDRDEKHDLALLLVDRYRPPRAFALASPREIRQNQQVMCFEYGGTESIAGVLTFSAAARVGNVTRVLKKVDWLGAAGENALELSFPALRGASGAPLLDNRRLRLWGVVTANLAHHLMPAQVESVFDGDGATVSQTQFMMPQALAINVQHVHALIGSGGSGA